MPLSDLLMNGSHLAAGSGKWEPQRQSNAILTIFGLGNLAADAQGPIKDVLTLALESFPIPKTVNEPIELRYLNGIVKVAGQKTLDEIDVVVKDMVDQPVHLTCVNWRNAVQDPLSDKIGLARDYKKDGEITLFGPNGEFQRVYQLSGLWPSRFDPGDVDYTSGEKMLLTMSLQLDRIIPKVSAWGGEIVRPNA